MSLRRTAFVVSLALLLAVGTLGGLGLISASAKTPVQANDLTGSSGRSTISLAKRLPGLEPALAEGSRDLGMTRANRQITVTLVLKPRQQDTLDALARSTTKANLTPSGFRSRFAPSKSTISSLRSWASNNNLKVSSVSPDRLLVDLSGSTEQMGRALGVAFHAYRTRGGINYVAANHAATLPETFASLTQAVVGLSTLGRVSVPHPPSPATLRPDATSGVNRGYPASYGPKAFWKLYNAPNKASQKGAGQKLAVIAAGNLSQPRRDLLTFERRFRLPRVRWNQINVGKPSRDTSGATEFSLDTQYSTAFAPGVRSLFVYDAHSLSDRDILAAMDRFVTGNRSKQASFSAGECERVARQGGLMSGLNTVLREGTAPRGRSIRHQALTLSGWAAPAY